MGYSIFLRPAAIRDLKGLPLDVRPRIEAAIDRLGNNPRPPGSKKLVGFNNERRLRVGDYRVLYVVADDQRKVTIARIAHRREVYR